MKTGIVKKWDELKGWGFIEDLNHHEDYFFNISNVRKGIIIKEGMKVKFDITVGQRGDEAENVGLI